MTIEKKLAISNPLYKMCINNARRDIRSQRDEGQTFTKFVEVLSVCWCISKESVFVDLSTE